MDNRTIWNIEIFLPQKSWHQASGLITVCVGLLDHVQGTTKTLQEICMKTLQIN